MTYRRVLSFSTLRDTRKALLPWTTRNTNTTTELYPRIPFELIYKLVDDYITPAKDVRTARAMAMTCRTLAAYCRALSFRSIHLEYSHESRYHPPLSRTEFPSQGRPHRFLRVIQASPRLLDYIQTLSFHYEKPRMPALRKSIAIDPSISQRKALNDALSLAYPSLRFLRISGYWEGAPGSVQQVILSLMQRSQQLESLELALVDTIPSHLLACLPQTVEHLTDHASHPPKDFDFTVICNILPARLHTLTFTRGDGWFLLDAIRAGCVPVSLASLHHLQIGSVAYSSPPFDLVTLQTLTSCSSTLQCLHIGVALYLHPMNHNHRHFLGRAIAVELIPLGELRSLKVLEIRTDISRLNRTLLWLSESITMIPAEETHEALTRLKVSLLFTHTLFCGCLSCLSVVKIGSADRKAGVVPRPYLQELSERIGEDVHSGSSSAPTPRLHAKSVTEWHERYWEWTMLTWGESWPNLHLVKFSLFLEHMDPATRHPVITGESPVAFQPSEDYTSLWDDCACSGWRYQT
jgi:hypothetical protein